MIKTRKNIKLLKQKSVLNFEHNSKVPLKLLSRTKNDKAKT